MNNRLFAMYAFVLVTILSVNLQGCAYVSAKKIPFGSTEQEGFPYYMKKPLLVVSNDSVKIIYIDDHTNLWGVKFGAVLAKNKTELVFGDGGLTSVTGDLDDQALALAFVDLAKSALTEAVKGGFLGGDVKGSTGKLQIFDILYDEHGAFKKLVPLINNADLLDVPNARAPATAPAPAPATPAASKPKPNLIPPPAKKN